MTPSWLGSLLVPSIKADLCKILPALVLTPISSSPLQVEAQTKISCAWYQNLMGSAPSTSDLQQLTGLIDSGAYSKGSLAVAAVSLTESLGKVDFTGLASQGWAYNLVS